MKHVKKILIVCAANTCRSPMAIKIMQKYLPEMQIKSAGIQAVDGNVISEHAKTILDRHGLNSSHEAKNINVEMIDASDLILVMEEKQIAEILSQRPCAKDKLFLLTKQMDGENISDPFGLTEKEYKNCFIRLEQSIKAWANFLDTNKGILS